MNPENKFVREPIGQQFNENESYKPSVPFFKFQETTMNIVIPKGEQFNGVMQFFNEIGLEIPENRNPRDFKIPVRNIPLILIPFRAGDIPKIVLDNRSSAKAGITGSDVIWESSYDLGTDRNEGETLPLDELVEDPPKSSLYLGATQEYADIIIDKFERDIEPTDLNGKTIVTIYPNITKEYLKSKNMDRSQIYTISGQDEAAQYVFNLEGILGIKSTGKTIEANRIVIIDEFFEVATILATFGTDKLTTRDMQLLNDLREMTWLALKKRGMV
ncbi:ATP phosphoribosyltransferase [Candidatus Shapirobacteria bacterium CG10_big_fil_rev_8_21_14_0_10_40_9]|uniref:ATP phosphoribosyltransferase n=1 Tax=Candidatus Shapirobacteria bacterium CG10_big_fil_rev_8_21_14_0_10_40_9 TaxID=1974888 RepID=A0A2M8L496_9BACT|nr:MAG: ATP phosphoribosyltransferase [Candidatus Shapirobacteria bacterium CG10_big_fil_rev_8_21_14_0_10_40_9]